MTETDEQARDGVVVGTRIRWGGVLEGYETGVVVEVLDSPITGKPRAFVVRPDGPELESVQIRTVAVIVGVEQVAGVVEEDNKSV